MVRSLAVSLAVLFCTANYLLPSVPAAAAVQKTVTRSAPKVVAKPAPKSVRAPATLESGAGLQPVLPPEQFFGAAAMGYSAAKQIPQTCSKLFCYCGCDITDNHRNLLDCFTNPHGADCHMCQSEALMAFRLRKGGQPLGEVQRQIDISYARQYPYVDPSPALKRYRATRLYDNR
jgi:hypothetical protein